MPGTDDDWHALTGLLAEAHRQVRRSTGATISSDAVRSVVRAMAEQYTRVVRPQLVRQGFSDSELADVDNEVESALRHTNRTCPRPTYLKACRDLKSKLGELYVAREMRMGATPPLPGTSDRTVEDDRILAALEVVLPATACGYEQALRDLRDSDRVSHRGVANELREVLRDVLDHLAPDKELAKAGVKADPQHGYTQKQKARFILRSRGLPENAREAPERLIELIEAAVSALTRATSVRASIAAHVSTGADEARRLKRYVEVVLGELLGLE